MASNERLHLAASHRFINLEFLSALVILAAIAAFSYVSISNFVKNEAQVGRSFELLTKTDLVLTRMLDAETGARGYLLTSRDSFLEPYLTAKQELPLALRALGEALVSRPAQHDLFLKLNGLSAQRLKVIDAMLALKRGLASRSRIQARLTEGKRLMDSLREVVTTMNAGEHALLTRRAEESNQSARQAIGVIVLGNMISFSLLIIGFAMLRQENRARAMVGNQLAAANVSLEYRVTARTAELAESNRQLNREIEEHQQARIEIAAINESLEQQVAHRTAQLEVSNKELESFSYSVSHDLRSPLRAIDGFSRVLQEDYSERLDGEAQRILGLVRGNSQKMAQLIDDLLAFSRLGRTRMSSTKVDMEALAREAANELDQNVGERLTEGLTLKPTPPTWGDRALLRQVWINLLSNAFKFSSKAPTRSVEVGGYADGDEQVYYVADNGAGFDMTYYDKLFGVFQRLHRAEEFPGTGVGLAIVQRVVERHCGRLWANSTIGEGATFYFTLPKYEPAGICDDQS